MKIYLSADIEGITGVTHWDETDLHKDGAAGPREQMTAEVVAACEGALQAGATEIWVKDAHDTARNIIAAQLPQATRLIRGWSYHPFMMLQELDNTFNGIVLVGYHSRAASGGSPLAHTLTGAFSRIFINRQPASEFLIQAHLAAYLKVPIVFISGDKGICDEATQYNSHIQAVAVKEGMGNSTINLHPDLARDRIRAGVAQALQGDVAQCLGPLPAHFSVEIQYRDPTKAYLYGFFPGARQLDPVTVQFESESYYEVMRFLLFAA
jgi:D-amino peptidase